MPNRIKSILIVALQFIFILLLLESTPLSNLSVASYPPIILSILLMLWAIITMFKSKLRILPEPATDAVLITDGPYRFIRHPMYTSILLGCMGLLITDCNFLRVAMTAALTSVLIFKIMREEKMLSEKFNDYKNYKQATQRLIPFIF